jgi:hypothetical protein
MLLVKKIHSACLNPPILGGIPPTQGPIATVLVVAQVRVHLRRCPCATWAWQVPVYHRATRNSRAANLAEA